jgi:CheY-like chemotaxis protein
MARLALHVGRDPAVLRRRSELLQDVGYDVTPSFSLSHAMDLIEQSRYDVVVLCESLLPEQRGRMLDFVHQESPSTRVVLPQGGSAPVQEPRKSKVLPFRRRSGI